MIRQMSAHTVHETEGETEKQRKTGQKRRKKEGKKEEKKNDEDKEERGMNDYNLMPFQGHNAACASERVYFIIESHHIGYTITILIRHNGYLLRRFLPRWGQKYANL